MSEEVQGLLSEILEELRVVKSLLNRLTLVEQATFISREAIDLQGRPRSTEALSKILTDAFVAAIDYSAQFSAAENRKLRENFERTLKID